MYFINNYCVCLHKDNLILKKKTNHATHMEKYCTSLFWYFVSSGLRKNIFHVISCCVFCVVYFSWCTSQFGTTLLKWLFKTGFLPVNPLKPIFLWSAQSLLRFVVFILAETFFYIVFSTARHSVMVGCIGPDLAGAQKKQPVIYFNLPRESSSHDQLMWLHPCTVSLQSCRCAVLLAVGFEGWLLFSSHYTASEMYPGGWVRGMEWGWLVVEIMTSRCCKSIYSVGPGLVEPDWAFLFCQQWKMKHFWILGTRCVSL